MKYNYWKDQEKFSKHIIKYVLLDLIKDWFEFKTTIWNYKLINIDEKGTSEWWSQLTDKIISLLFKNKINEQFFLSYLYIESKAYFSEWSESLSSIEKSFKKFYTDLWSDYWYASSYCIFKWWENQKTYPFLDKLIEDNIDCPEYYFEITKEIFEDKSYNNTLEHLLKSINSIKKENEKYQMFDNYINTNPSINSKLKEKVKNNIIISFNKYETSEKRLNIILKNRHSNNKSKEINIISDIKNGFSFKWNEQSNDLNKAIDYQKEYLINKNHYFWNPLIRKNIEELEYLIPENTFEEIDQEEFSNLIECSNEFINEMDLLEIPKESHKKVKWYLFEWGKKQKRWFLFDCWAKKKSLLEYDIKNNIKFINKLWND